MSGRHGRQRRLDRNIFGVIKCADVVRQPAVGGTSRTLPVPRHRRPRTRHPRNNHQATETTVSEAHRPPKSGREHPRAHPTWARGRRRKAAVASRLRCACPHAPTKPRNLGRGPATDRTCRPAWLRPSIGHNCQIQDGDVRAASGEQRQPVEDPMPLSNPECPGPAFQTAVPPLRAVPTGSSKGRK